MTEALFAAGVLTTATRVGFARHYDLTENVLPPEVVAREVDDDEAVRELTLRAATALGVGTEADIRDYFRLGCRDRSSPRSPSLSPTGSSNRSRSTAGMRRRICVPARSIPRRDRGTALLCPFDPLIFFRPRVQRLFDFHYRIEIYVPAPKRQFGYYVWPFLLDGQPCRSRRPEGRTHPRRTARRRRFHRTRARQSRVAKALASELRTMANWLGLAEVTVGTAGDLTKELSRSLA